TLPIGTDQGKLKTSDFADALAEGILGRLVRAQLGKGPKVKGKDTFRIKIENFSPLVLNGVAILGDAKKEGATPNVLPVVSLPPGKSMSVPATSQIVDQLGLKKGVRVYAANLGSL
ncbi:hypothetical protein ACYOEI_19020, partial [Singulisphaera rosea]